jgi:hypothetical protein
MQSGSDVENSSRPLNGAAAAAAASAAAAGRPSRVMQSDSEMVNPCKLLNAAVAARYSMGSDSEDDLKNPQPPPESHQACQNQEVFVAACNSCGPAKPQLRSFSWAKCRFTLSTSDAFLGISFCHKDFSQKLSTNPQSETHHRLQFLVNRVTWALQDGDAGGQLQELCTQFAEMSYSAAQGIALTFCDDIPAPLVLIIKIVEVVDTMVQMAPCSHVATGLRQLSHKELDGPNGLIASCLDNINLQREGLWTEQLRLHSAMALSLLLQGRPDLIATHGQAWAEPLLRALHDACLDCSSVLVTSLSFMALVLGLLQRLTMNADVVQWICGGSGCGIKPAAALAVQALERGLAFAEKPDSVSATVALSCACIQFLTRLAQISEPVLLSISAEDLVAKIVNVLSIPSLADHVLLSSRLLSACWEFTKATQEASHRAFRSAGGQIQRALLQADFGLHCADMLQRTFDHEMQRRDSLQDVLLASPQQLPNAVAETNKNTLWLCEALSSVEDILTLLRTRPRCVEKVRKLRESPLLSGSESDSASQVSNTSRRTLEMMRRSLACLVSGWSMQKRPDRSS